MPGKNPSILDHVPDALRSKLPHYEAVLPTALAPLLTECGADADTMIGFISGALEFQLLSDSESSKTFKGTIKRVEVIERKPNGFLLGKKANIIFEAPTQSGKVTEQNINTGWTEYNGSDAHLEAFNVALSNTLVDIAKANIGREVFIRKVMVEGVETSSGGDKVRFVGDIRPDTRGDKKASSSAESQSRGRADAKGDDGPSDDFTVSDFRDEAKSQKVDVSEFQNADIKDIIKAGDDLKEIASIITDVLGLKKADVVDILDCEAFDDDRLKVIIEACVVE